MEITLQQYQDSLNKKIKHSAEMFKQINVPFHLSIVFAVYNEIERMKPKKESSVGEDSIRVKVSQLNELFSNTNKGTWTIYIVDDGCPYNSGKFAEEIANTLPERDQIKVLYLNQAIKQNLPPIKTLTNTSESKKGGAILYGMWQAKEDNKNRKNHVVIFTDADTSTDLRQSGLLIDKIINKNYITVIGSRRAKDSCVIKTGIRNTRGKLFIYLWKQLLSPCLKNIADTQCPFKAFNANYIDKLVSNNIEFQFAFDIELLLKTEIIDKKRLQKIGIAWKDSTIASTVGGNETYLDMLKSIANMYRYYNTPSSWSNEYADFVENLTLKDLDKLIDNTPKYISETDPIEFEPKISVNDLKRIIKAY